MPALEPSAKKKTSGKKIPRLLIVVLTLILPLVLLVVALLVFYQTNASPSQEEAETISLPEGTLSPAQLVDNKYRYKDQRLTIMGRVDQATVTCEKKDCPPEDSCCGCPDQRDLVIADTGKTVFQKSNWVLRLLGPQGQSFCQRLPGNCDYECSDWEKGSVYEVKGIFHADPPPRGSAWRPFLDFYFEAEAYQLVGRGGFWICREE